MPCKSIQEDGLKLMILIIPFQLILFCPRPFLTIKSTKLNCKSWHFMRREEIMKQCKIYWIIKKLWRRKTVSCSLFTEISSQRLSIWLILMNISWWGSMLEIDSSFWMHFLRKVVKLRMVFWIFRSSMPNYYLIIDRDLEIAKVKESSLCNLN